MLKKSKKIFACLSCMAVMAMGCVITASAGSKGTVYPRLPGWRSQINVVTGTHTGPYTNVTLYGNIDKAYCNVIYGRTNVTGTFTVSYGHLVKASNCAPQNSTVVLQMGNDDSSAYTYDATVSYDL